MNLELGGLAFEVKPLFGHLEENSWETKPMDLEYVFFLLNVICFRKYFTLISYQ